jgi:hypothetical protein
VLLVAVVIALVLGGSSTGNAVSADPAPPPVAAPAPVTPIPSVFVTPTPTASPTPSDSPSPSTSESASASASASPSASASASAEPKAEATTKAKAKAKAKAKKAAPTACDPGDLRATLTGKRQLKPEQATTFDLSLINGSGATCVVDVDAKSFELKIYSGTDRIWSSADCAKSVEPITKKVKAEDAVEWSMRWDGRRSRAGCKDRPEIPQPGTYFATAQLDGAKPVQLRMILRG